MFDFVFVIATFGVPMVVVYLAIKAGLPTEISPPRIRCFKSPVAEFIAIIGLIIATIIMFPVLASLPRCLFQGDQSCSLNLRLYFLVLIPIAPFLLAVFVCIPIVLEIFARDASDDS